MVAAGLFGTIDTNLPGVLIAMIVDMKHHDVIRGLVGLPDLSNSCRQCRVGIGSYNDRVGIDHPYFAMTPLNGLYKKGIHIIILGFDFRWWQQHGNVQVDAVAVVVGSVEVANDMGEQVVTLSVPQENDRHGHGIGSGSSSR